MTEAFMAGEARTSKQIEDDESGKGKKKGKKKAEKQPEPDGAEQNADYPNGDEKGTEDDSKAKG